MSTEQLAAELLTAMLEVARIEPLTEGAADSGDITELRRLESAQKAAALRLAKAIRGEL